MEISPFQDEAMALEQAWQNNIKPQPLSASKELITQIATSLRFLPEEMEDPLLQLPWFSLKKRHIFLRYRVSIHAMLWYWALREVATERAYPLLQTVQPIYSANLGKRMPTWRQIMIDMDFFQTILDNYREEGFLSVAQHVTWRVHGDFTQDLNLLEIAVALSFYMDRVFEECRVRVHHWAGRTPTMGVDRLTGLLDDEAFSGNWT
ncbi:MAG: hypothetical protein HQL07_07585 [Nitrospirae bacterium]|nr:hypothetical protein [Magnetococcales bacterium]HAT50408.1 hypothetical protein [Alphaproteobacteria bacterium]